MPFFYNTFIIYCFKKLKKFTAFRNMKKKIKLILGDNNR